MIPDVPTILDLCRWYCEAADIAESTLSTRVFNDGKVIGRLAEGSDLTTGRAASALRWLSDNWPTGAERPEPLHSIEAAEDARALA